MERKTKVNLAAITIALLTIASSSFAQVTGTFASKLSSGVSLMFFSYFKPAMQIGLFIFMCWEIYQGFHGRDKKEAWTHVIAMIAVIAILEYMPAIWTQITGVTISQ